MSERVPLGVVYLQVLLQINRSNIDCEQSLFRPKKQTSRGEPRVARASTDERKESVFKTRAAGGSRFRHSSLHASVRLRSFPHIFERRSQSRSDKISNYFETYLNGVNDTLTFLPQTTPLSPAHGLIIQQQQQKCGLTAKNIK